MGKKLWIAVAGVENERWSMLRLLVPNDYYLVAATLAKFKTLPIIQCLRPFCVGWHLSNNRTRGPLRTRLPEQKNTARIVAGEQYDPSPFQYCAR